MLTRFLPGRTRALLYPLTVAGLLATATTVAHGGDDGATVVADASAQAGAGANTTAGNTCPQDLDRWGQIRGEEPERDGGVYRQDDNDTTNPSFYLPQQAVAGGQQWRFAYDTTVGDSPDNDDGSGLGGARVRIEVDWYSTPGGDNSGYMGHVDGPWVNVPVNSTAATRVSHTFTAPNGAVRANVLTDLSTDDPDNTWTGRNCDYRRIEAQPPPAPPPPPPAPPTTTTTTAAPPATRPVSPPPTTPPVTARPAQQQTAAARYGWGEPIPEGSDDFDYGSQARPAPPDQTKWEVAGSGEQCWPGYRGNGRRCAANSRVHGGVLRIVGEANGDTGWVASRFGQQYGRWEARVRSRGTGENNGQQYHPLLILWPDSDDWPQDGEYDFLENGEPGAQCAEAFIHYPHDETAPRQQEFAQRCDVDLSQWHHIAIEWSPDHVKGFIDGVEWFSFSGGENAVRQCIQCAPGPMHQTIQLDNFFGDPMQPAVYEVDWTRAYAL